MDAELVLWKMVHTNYGTYGSVHTRSVDHKEVWQGGVDHNEFLDMVRQQERRSRLCLAVFGLTVLALVATAFGLDHYMESVKASDFVDDDAFRATLLRTVLFERPLGERLGFVLAFDDNGDYPYFTELVEGGLAEVSGEIELFDRLVSINDDYTEDRAGVLGLRTWIEGRSGEQKTYGDTGETVRRDIWRTRKTLEDVPETYGDATQVELKVIPRSSRSMGVWPDEGLSTWEVVTCQAAACQALAAMLSAQLGGLLSLLQASSILFSCALGGLVAVAVLTQTHLVRRASALAWRLVVFAWKPASHACAAMVTRMRSAVSCAATARAEARANELLQQEEASSARTERPAKSASASTRKQVVGETKAERRTAGEHPRARARTRARACARPHAGARACICAFPRPCTCTSGRRCCARAEADARGEGEGDKGGSGRGERQTRQGREAAAGEKFYRRGVAEGAGGGGSSAAG